jgi:hypothetical protein
MGSSNAGGSRIGHLRIVSSKVVGSRTIGSRVGCSRTSTSLWSASAAVNATVAMRVQGSINQLTNVVEKMFSNTDDPVMAVWCNTIGLLQAQQDGLSAVDKALMIELFIEDTVITQTYILIINHNIWSIWLKKRLVLGKPTDFTYDI